MDKFASPFMYDKEFGCLLPGQNDVVAVTFKPEREVSVKFNVL